MTGPRHCKCRGAEIWRGGFGNGVPVDRPWEPRLLFSSMSFWLDPKGPKGQDLAKLPPHYASAHPAAKSAHRTLPNHDLSLPEAGVGSKGWSMPRDGAESLKGNKGKACVVPDCKSYDRTSTLQVEQRVLHCKFYTTGYLSTLLLEVCNLENLSRDFKSVNSTSGL